MTASSLSLSSIQALAGTTVASTGAGIVAWSLPFDAVGIPAAIVFMALAGTAAGMLWQPPGGSRWRLFGLAFTYTVVAAATAVVAPELKLLAWLKPVAPAAASLIAAGLAVFSEKLLPVIGAALAERAKRSIGGGK